MEPVSTLMLVASFLVTPAITSHPRWEKAHDDDNIFVMTPDENYLRNFLWTSSATSTTQQLVAPHRHGSETTSLTLTDPKTGLYEQLATFRPSNENVPQAIQCKEEDVDKAVRFVESIPSGVPLPTLMRSEDGEIGLYWDTSEAYIDINFDQDGTLSLYSRLRRDGSETFAEGIQIEAVDASWAYENLCALAFVYTQEA